MGEIIELTDGVVKLYRETSTGARRLDRGVAFSDFLGAFAEELRLHSEISTPLLPPGVICYRQRGPRTVIAVEQPPQRRRVLWINEAERPELPYDAYLERTLAFPYVVIILTFDQGQLDTRHQLYYRSAPLSSLDDMLMEANLLNVARDSDSPCCWLCLGKLEVADLPWNRKIQAALEFLWSSGFNRDLEVPRGSGFTRLWDVDPRVASVADWERASAQDPLFPLTVSWPALPLTLDMAIAESLAPRAPRKRLQDLAGLADLVYRLPESLDV